MLYPIKGKNQFCGPAAIAATLGISTDQAARAIRWYNPEVTRCTATTAVQIMRTCNALGILESRAYFRTGTSSMAQLMEEISGPAILGVPGHWVAVCNGVWCDNNTPAVRGHGDYHDKPCDAVLRIDPKGFRVSALPPARLLSVGFEGGRVSLTGHEAGARELVESLADWNSLLHKRGPGAVTGAADYETLHSLIDEGCELFEGHRYGSAWSQIAGVLVKAKNANNQELAAA